MKGVWFTMESMIACIIIGMFVIFVSTGYVIEFQYVDASEMAYDILKGLEDRDVLRGYAIALDYEGLGSEIDITGYNHTVNICNSAGSCVGPEPDAADVWVGSYLIAGQSVYQPLEVKLFVWELS